MIWVALIFAAVATGAARQGLWTIVICPVLSVAVGGFLVLTEPTNYDMHGLGLFIGFAGAAACLIAWLAAYGLAVLVTRGRARG